jgi:hypothetical protein
MEEQGHPGDETAVNDDLPADREARPYEDVRDRIALAREITSQRLRDLRGQREEINAEIKLLVEEDDLLTRMARITKRAKEVRDGDEPATEPVVHK